MSHCAVYLDKANKKRYHSDWDLVFADESARPGGGRRFFENQVCEASTQHSAPVRY